MAFAKGMLVAKLLLMKLPCGLADLENWIASLLRWKAALLAPQGALTAFSLTAFFATLLTSRFTADKAFLLHFGRL